MWPYREVVEKDHGRLEVRRCYVFDQMRSCVLRRAGLDETALSEQSNDSLHSLGAAMLAKMTSKNQLTLPKALVVQVGASEYFDVEARNGQLVLTPVRIQRGDVVRAKLAELNLTEADIADAVTLARTPK